MLDMEKKYADGIDPVNLNFRNSLFYIRPISNEDLQTLFTWRIDSRVSRYLSASPPKNMKEQRQWYKRYQQDHGSLHFMVTNKNSFDAELGYCQLFKIDGDKRTAEFGVVLGSEEYIRSGLGIRLGVTLMKIAFSYLGIISLFANTHPENRVPNRFFRDFIGSEKMTSPHAYSKRNEVLYHTSKPIFELFEEKILSKNSKWSEVLNIERVDLSGQ